VHHANATKLGEIALWLFVLEVFSGAPLPVSLSKHIPPEWPVHVLNIEKAIQRGPHLSFSVQKYARKVHFYKPCTSTASESEFDLMNKIPCLKVSVLVYTESRSSNAKANYGSLAYSLVASPVASLLQNRQWNRLRNFFILRHVHKILTEDISNAPKSPAFSAAPFHLRASICNLVVCVWTKAHEET